VFRVCKDYKAHKVLASKVLKVSKERRVCKEHREHKVSRSRVHKDYKELRVLAFKVFRD
jgi:hypothetical protein